jgi:alpha-ketoglutarate-dependent taurine dioxygenase
LLASTTKKLQTDDEHSSAAEAVILASLPAQYLRAMDPAFTDANGQRTDVQFCEKTGKPLIKQHARAHSMQSCSAPSGDSSYRVVWDDGLVSRYAKQWVDKQVERWKGESMTDRIFWTGLTEDDLRSSSNLCTTFDHALTEEGMELTLTALYQYGILLVTDTPCTGPAIAALASSLSGGAVKNESTLLHHYLQQGESAPVMLPTGTDGPLRTLYGTVWSTVTEHQADGASTADSAYGRTSLPLHTDMTYHRDPPGLQIFAMVRPATAGGESCFGDGFAAAERLRRTDPVAFDTLSSVVRRYRCRDTQTGWLLEATGPVISVDESLSSSGGRRRRRIAAIRHNDLDRLPDLPQTDQDADEFYARLQQAHTAWDQILADDDMRLILQLRPGETIVVANQRCLHGRHSFRGPRSVMGCYVSQDELNSRFRLAGFDC